MRPELPYLAAGAISITGGVARTHGWPPEGLRALVATIILVVITSATAETRIAPLVKAFGFLVVLVAIIAAVPAFNTHKSTKGK